MHKVELLAPVGSATALHAAVVAGADAVYLGLENFNARRNADNFTLDTLAQAADYAHLRGVAVYVALNTLILPDEFTSALECARQAYRAGADAFIVQDIGLASEISRTLPQARLHISTQMNVHNKAGIRAAARLGARRVTLARELSLPEIAALAQEASAYDMEIETFVHGALCVCYSGQCLMSSLVGGRSANRGLCAQACRLPYKLRNHAVRKELPAPGDHLLSPQDLCAIDLLPELISSGVASLKIEGRMKSPDYVHAVTSTYRAALDKLYEQQDVSASVDSASAVAALTYAPIPATADSTFIATSTPACATSVSTPLVTGKRALEEAFSRGFTTAYLEGKRGNEIMSYKRPNNRGAFIGRVARVSEDKAYIESDYALVVGDIVEFWTGKGHVSQMIRRIESSDKVDAKTSTKTGTKPANKSSKKSRDKSNPQLSAKDNLVCIPLDSKAAHCVRAGDRVFRVRSVEVAFEDDVFSPRVPIKGQAILKMGEPLQISFSLAHALLLMPTDASTHALAGSSVETQPYTPTGTARGNVVEAARTKSVSEQEVYDHINRLGQTPFELTTLDIELDEGVGIGFSELHKVRTRALDDLEQEILSPYHTRKLEKSPRAITPVATRASGCRVFALATNPVCARSAKRGGAHTIYVSALNYEKGSAVIAGQATETAESTSYPEHCAIALPTIEHDLVAPARETTINFDVWHRVHEGTSVLVDSLAALQRAVEVGASFDVGPHLPVTNRTSLAFVASLGANRVWLSPELTLSQIKELAYDKPCELGLFVIGAQEVMICEHCLLMSQGECTQECTHCARRKSPHFLQDRKNFEFPVVTDLLGRSHLYNSVPLDVVSAMPDLLAAGVSSFLVDTTLMNSEESYEAAARVRRAVRVAQNDGNTLAKMPDTTTGHLFRGVS